MSSKASFLTGSSSAAWRSSSLRLLRAHRDHGRADGRDEEDQQHPSHAAQPTVLAANRGGHQRAPKAAVASRSSSGASTVKAWPRLPKCHASPSRLLPPATTRQVPSSTASTVPDRGRDPLADRRRPARAPAPAPRTGTGSPSPTAARTPRRPGASRGRKRHVVARTSPSGPAGTCASRRGRGRRPAGTTGGRWPRAGTAPRVRTAGSPPARGVGQLDPHPSRAARASTSRRPRRPRRRPPSRVVIASCTRAHLGAQPRGHHLVELGERPHARPRSPRPPCRRPPGAARPPWRSPPRRRAAAAAAPCPRPAGSRRRRPASR